MTGTVRLEEAGARVRLRGADGQVHGLGAVPVGTYTVEASWDLGTWSPTLRGVAVTDGQVVVLRCKQRFRKCQVL